MTEGKLHGAIPELLALFRRQLVHPWTVLLHDQRAARLLFGDDGFVSFHEVCIPQRADDVKPVTAEELTDYLRDIGVNVRYLHSEIDGIERVEILRALRKGEFDVLVGINLLREGLDLPEVSLVAILDADKEGFLRSETSLIQTAGRAARHLNGEVILYADVMTDSIKRFLAVTEYRRQKQVAYNTEHNITPRSVKRAVEESLVVRQETRQEAAGVLRDAGMDVDLTETINELESEMLTAANNLEFEKAALLRDQIKELKRAIDGSQPAKSTTAFKPICPISYGGKRQRKMRH